MNGMMKNGKFIPFRTKPNPVQDAIDHYNFLQENEKHTAWSNEADKPKLISAYSGGSVAKSLVNKNGGKIGVMFVVNDKHKMKQFNTRKEAKHFQEQFNNHVNSIKSGSVKLPHTF